VENIEKDIRPEDFKEGSVWGELVRECGGKAALILARHHGGDKLYILSEATITEAARKRYYAKMKTCS